MNIGGTEMHIVTFVITVFELAMLFFQVIYFLERTNDRNRLYYLILLIFLILYNVCSGLFPDPKIPIPIQIQVILSYLVGFAMSMYVVYYFYIVFELEHLRLFATRGVFIFLLLPFFLGFLLPYLYTGNLKTSRQLTVIVPFFYGLGFIYYTAKALRAKYKNASKRRKKDDLYGHAVAVYISVICWAMLPVIVFFGDFQVIEQTVTNAGFLAMSIVYVRSSIQNARKEFRRLSESESVLKAKVEIRTAQLKELNDRMKNVFINVAHEIKTPLMLVNNYLHDYTETRTQGDLNNNNIINAQTFLNKLTADIVNLFDIQSLERGFAIYDHRKACSFSQILIDKIDLFRHHAEKNGIIIESEIEDDLQVMANPYAIERVTNNLITNAIKFSISGGQISIKLYSNGDKIIFSVIDEGIGMDSNVQKKVFEPFYRLSQPTEGYREGMGLGLAIVKAIVDSLNGVIKIESHVGQGTEVSVTFHRHQNFTPVDKHVVSNDFLAVPSPDSQDVLSDRTLPHVLLVENNASLASYLSGKLGQHFNVYVCLNGSDAMRRLPSLKRIDVIICDIMMEKVSGYDFFRIISTSQSWKHVPFIFITARSGDRDRLAAFKLGAIHYLEKPFLTSELIFKVQALISNLKAQHAALTAGAPFIPNEAAASTTGKLRSLSIETGLAEYDLTQREVEVARLVAMGQPYKEIADQLNISVKTVSRHVTNIFSKMSVSNRVELVHKLGLVQ